MGLLQEFKDFAMRGNVVDLAVGVVIGGAFGKIVTALVEKMIMPIVGLLTGGVDFSIYKIPVEVPGKTKVEIQIGAFATEVINFLIIAFAIFMVVKAMNAAQKRFSIQKPAGPPPPPEDIVLLREIRDALKTR